MTVETYRPPLEVHVCWPATVAPSPATLQLADRIHRRLGTWTHRVPDRPQSSQPTGAGIPVLLGTPAQRLSSDDRLLVADTERTARVIVGVLDTDSFVEQSRDRALEEVLSTHPLACVIALDGRWSARFPLGRLVPPERCLDVLAPVITRALGGPDIVRLFLDEPSSEPSLRDAVRLRILDRELDGLFRYTRGGTKEVRDDPRSALFVHVRREAGHERARSDGYLVAKELRIPVVSAQCLATGEEREPAYAGNGPVVVVRTGEPGDIDRLIDECVRVWLAHSYFKADAKRLRRAYGLPLETIPLSRAPELVDFAQGTLPPTSSVVLYPDPPLPVDEATLIQRQYPRVRLVTPTTLHGQMLARRARPPLDGMRVALSLSRAPELPSLTATDPLEWKGGRHPDGLTERHYEEAARYLTTCLIHAGAELAYGGSLDVVGRTGLLSSIVSQYRQLQRNTDDLLHVYVTDATKSTPTAGHVSAAIHECRSASGPGAPSDEVRDALDYGAMREQMALECDARIILGGKTRPIERPYERKHGVYADGYSGRFPGQAKEAWAMLHAERGPKPVYVIGAFGGAAALVGRALAGDTASLPGEADLAGVAGYASFCAEVDPLRTAGPLDVDSLWTDVREKGWPKDDDALWTNGLTRGENRRLLESTQVREIAALVMHGLMRVARQRASGPTAQLTIMPYHGSIAGCPPVEAYVVPIVSGLPMEGAGGALDAAMNGRLRSEREAQLERHLQRPGDTAVISARDSALAGDWVMLVSLGGRDEIPDDTRRALELQRLLGERIGERALELGWRELATVPMGGNLGLSPGRSLRAFVVGLRSVEGLQLDSLVVCETDSGKADEVEKTCLDLSREHDDISARTVPADPVPPRTSRSPLILIVRRDQGQLASLLIPPRANTNVQERREPIDAALDAFLTGPVLNAVAPTQLQAALRSRLIGDEQHALLRQWRGHAVRVVHDEACAALPFELLLTADVDGVEHCFAREEGVTRELTTTTATRQDRTTTTGRLRVLIVADPKNNLPLARAEAERLKTDLELRGVRVVGPLLGEKATCNAVLKACKEVDVLHYAGHAGPSGLALHDDVFGAAHIAKLKKKRPALVVLNACRTGVLEAARAGDDSLARVLLNGGTRCLVSTGWLIPDGMGARFGRRFICEVADAIPVGAAFARTLRALRDDDFDLNYWFYYRLFGDADLVLG